MRLTVSDTAIQITVQDHTFRLGRRGIMLPDDISFEAWTELYESALVLADMSTWALADLLVYGLRHFPDEAYNVIGDATQLSRGRLMNMKSVAEHVPIENRVFRLSFSHYTEVAKIEDKGVQYAWLLWAEDNEAGRDDLRMALSGEYESAPYLPPVRPSTPISALYWIRDALEGRRPMTKKQIVEVINEVIRRYASPDEDEE